MKRSTLVFFLAGVSFGMYAASGRTGADGPMEADLQVYESPVLSLRDFLKKSQDDTKISEQKIPAAGQDDPALEIIEKDTDREEAENRKREEEEDRRLAGQAVWRAEVMEKSRIREISQEEFRELILDYEQPNLHIDPDLGMPVLDFKIQKPAIILIYGKSSDRSMEELQDLNTVQITCKDRVDFFIMDFSECPDVNRFFGFRYVTTLLFIRTDGLYFIQDTKIPPEELESAIPGFLLPRRFSPHY